jgi:hypothetical protein
MCSFPPWSATAASHNNNCASMPATPRPYAFASVPAFTRAPLRPRAPAAAYLEQVDFDGGVLSPTRSR